MKNILVGLSLLLLIVLFSCSKKSLNVISVKSDTALNEFIPSKSAQIQNLTRNCRKPLSYVPTGKESDPMYEQIIRVNMHFMNNSKKNQNFKGAEAIRKAHELIKHCNHLVNVNLKMRLPEGNKTPKLPATYRYEITPDSKVKGDVGVYEHVDEELYYFVKKGKQRNNYSKTVIKKYAVHDDSILNIFVLPHHPDSIRAKNYMNSKNGIALGTSVKLAGWYEEGRTVGQMAPLLNHEIGHVFGLGHAWTGDGCDDTPKHSNCWDNNGPPPCVGLTSNNMMDYNNSQQAITPCQIGKVHKNMSSLNTRQRKLIIPQWCDYDPDFKTIVKGNDHWAGQRDLVGDVIVKSGATLRLSCRVSFPAGAKMILEPGSTLILDNARLHNSCGDTWGGYECQVSGKNKPEIIKLGEVLIEDLEE